MARASSITSEAYKSFTYYGSYVDLYMYITFVSNLFLRSFSVYSYSIEFMKPHTVFICFVLVDQQLEHPCRLFKAYKIITYRKIHRRTED